MASICCSPPERRVPWLLLPLQEVREQAVDRLVGHAAGTDLREQRQVLLGREAGEDAALLGTVADAEANDAVRRQADRLAAVHHDRTRPARDEAEDRT